MKKLGIPILGLIGLTLCVWFTVVEPFVRAAARQREQRDRVYLHIACFTAKLLYERVGVVYTDLESVVNSSFFPFTPPPASCSRLEIELTVRETPATVEWIGAAKNGYDRRPPVAVRSNRLSPEERTRRQLAFLARGSEAWIGLANEVRSGLSKKFPLSSVLRRWREVCEEELLPKSFSSPPRLHRESGVALYEQWLGEFCGELVLYDAWGRRVQLQFQGGGLTVSSAGADGRWGTADDIKATQSGQTK